MPGTAEPLVFCFGNFKPYKRNWQEKEEMKNEIMGVQKEFKVRRAHSSLVYMCVLRQGVATGVRGWATHDGHSAHPQARRGHGLSLTPKLLQLQVQPLVWPPF